MACVVLTGVDPVRPARFQKEMPFRINRPTKMAVSDRPNTCAVTRSLVLIMTSTLYFGFVFMLGRR